MKLDTESTRARWLTFVSQQALPLEVSCKPWEPSRTNKQNAYLWGVVYRAIADATGQSADDWHEYFLGEHFGWEEEGFFGRKKLKPIKRSSKLNKEAFNEFLEFIFARASENGIFISDVWDGE